MRIEWGKLTEEECAAIFREAASCLTEQALFELLGYVLTKDQKVELALAWQEGE